MKKCSVCYTYHEPKDYHVWTIYEKPVYWTLPDDGAPVTCHDCNKEKSMVDVYLTQLTCGKRDVVCKECIDEDWKVEFAEYKGRYKD